jgi:hypothetical protein
MEALIKIQSELKAPKNNYNSFGKYNYRNAEDILEAVKPLLVKHGCVLTLSDQIQEVGGRVYVTTTARISDGKSSETVTASAREAQDRKGMDDSQITGATSSYARKYALGGLFLLDDTKDADATNNHAKEEAWKEPVQPPTTGRPRLIESTREYLSAIQWVKSGNTMDSIKKKYSVSKEVEESIINAAKAQREKDEKVINNS